MIDAPFVEKYRPRSLKDVVGQDEIVSRLKGFVNDAAASTTVFITTLASDVDNYYNDADLQFTSGALAGQARKILDYTGATKTVTLATALTSAPANSVTFVVLGRSE